MGPSYRACIWIHFDNWIEFSVSDGSLNFIYMVKLSIGGHFVAVGPVGLWYKGMMARMVSLKYF